MPLLQSIWQLICAVLIWFHETTIEPESGGQPLPPIRYDGDPTEIYLA